MCEEYSLHRETYYLAKDMLDRFLDTRCGLMKEQLQLIGVACLFISAKIEVGQLMCIHPLVDWTLCPALVCVYTAPKAIV